MCYDGKAQKSKWMEEGENIAEIPVHGGLQTANDLSLIMFLLHMWVPLIFSGIKHSPFVTF